MRKTLVLLFYCSIVLLWGCSAPGVYTGESKIEPLEEAYTWDFGRVKEGEVLKHAFVLKNDTEVALKIKDTSTSCSCIASEVKKKVLLPGEGTLLEVKFNSKGYAGPTQQHVYVHTDRLDNSVIKYTIKAEVIKEGGK